MVQLFRPGASGQAQDVLAALDRSLAVIEFALDGRVITANERFLKTLGYTLAEVQGQHHRMFVDPEECESPGYAKFWDELRAGVFQQQQFRRMGKGGREVWIEATYNPITRADGRPYKVVKLATDITARVVELSDLRGQAEAIGRSNAVISFTMDGTILDANQQFLDAVGYRLDEIVGRKHSMFLEPGAADKQSYREFWERLNRGEFQSGQFRRVGRDGRAVYLQAAYNVILDARGDPMKVAKYATDITKRVLDLSGLKAQIDANFDEIGRAVVASRQETEHAAQALTHSTSNMQSMSASVEELAASVAEIADAMAKSRAAVEAVQEKRVAVDQTTLRLDETSRAMGGIVALIRNIAGQINLLALNATIESARAGEAGKGFAVVAGEVKNLAQQARVATDEIAREIEKLQSVSGEVVGALAGIGMAISEIRDYVVATAGAVEEQSVVTRGISAEMQRTTESVSAINDNMSAMTAAVTQVDHAVLETREAAKVLATA